MRVKWACIGLWGILCTLVCVNSAVPTAAQAPPELEHVALQYHDGGLTFYGIDASGNFVLITSLPGFGLVNLDFDSYRIRHPDDIALSPDGHHIAFTAVAATSTTLFIYTPGLAELHKVSFPGLAKPIWSSASDALLLTRPRLYMGTYDLELHDVYLYTLASDELTLLIANTPDSLLGGVEWSPDDAGIVFSRDGELYFRDRLEWNETRLTNSESFHPGLYCWDHSPVWLEATQRLYFAADCYDPGGELPHDSLHSVDLSGAERLEIDLPASYPQDIFTEIVGVFASSVNASVYLVTTSNSEEDMQNGQWPLAWRLFRLAASRQWDLIAEARFYDIDARPAYSLALSPDEQRLALSGHIWDGHQTSGYLSVVDLGTGQVSEWRTTHSVCAVQWLNSGTLLYAEFEGVCDNASKKPTGIWRLNIETGIITEIGAGLDGTVWLLPAPQVIPTNISPEASAGPDMTMPASGSGTALVTLDGTASTDSDGTLEAYRWYENDTLIAEGITSQVELGIGEHTIVLTVVDDDGAINWDEVVITVEPAVA